MAPSTHNSTGTYLIAFPAIFFIAVMLLVLVLLFIFVIMPVVSRQKRRASKCPSCGTRLRVKDHFCPHCGYQLHKEVQRVSPPLDQLYAPAVLARVVKLIQEQILYQGLVLISARKGECLSCNFFKCPIVREAYLLSCEALYVPFGAEHLMGCDPLPTVRLPLL